jgi:hypothetical protein
MESRAELFGRLNEVSPTLAADLVDPLAEFLRVARDVVGGDSDKVLLMIEITARSSHHPEFRDLDPARILAGQIERLPSLGTNMRSLADSTGVPRETVRRKVKELVDAGWVEWCDGRLHYTPAGYRAVAPAREAILRMAVRYFEVLGNWTKAQLSRPGAADGVLSAG